MGHDLTFVDLFCGIAAMTRTGRSKPSSKRFQATLATTCRTEGSWRTACRAAANQPQL